MGSFQLRIDKTRPFTAVELLQQEKNWAHWISFLKHGSKKKVASPGDYLVT